MGFFDLANPAFDLLDGYLSVVFGAAGKLAFWALAGAATSMLLYRLSSRQQALAELGPRIKEARKTLATFDGELEEILPLVWQSLALSSRQFGLALGPALLASLPLIFLLLWISNRYQLAPPSPGSVISVSIQIDPGSKPSWLPTASATTVEKNLWQIAWPDPSASLQLMVPGHSEILRLPTPELSPVVHKRQWWNLLIGNPAGYLGDDQPVQAVFLELPTKTYLPFGPGWVRGWEFVFFGLLFSFSMAIKLIFKIH